MKKIIIIGTNGKFINGTIGENGALLDMNGKVICPGAVTLRGKEIIRRSKGVLGTTDANAENKKICRDTAIDEFKKAILDIRSNAKEYVKVNEDKEYLVGPFTGAKYMKTMSHDQMVEMDAYSAVHGIRSSCVDLNILPADVMINALIDAYKNNIPKNALDTSTDNKNEEQKDIDLVKYNIIDVLSTILAHEHSHINKSSDDDNGDVETDINPVTNSQISSLSNFLEKEADNVKADALNVPRYQKIAGGKFIKIIPNLDLSVIASTQDELDMFMHADDNYNMLQGFNVDLVARTAVIGNVLKDKYGSDVFEIDPENGTQMLFTVIGLNGAYASSQMNLLENALSGIDGLLFKPTLNKNGDMLEATFTLPVDFELFLSPFSSENEEDPAV